MTLGEDVNSRKVCWWHGNSNKFRVKIRSWWHHQIETFSALLAICAGNLPVPSEFSAQRPVTRSFDVLFDLRLIKRLSKQSRGWWFETLSYPLWRHRNNNGSASGIQSDHLINNLHYATGSAVVFFSARENELPRKRIWGNLPSIVKDRTVLNKTQLIINYSSHYNGTRSSILYEKTITVYLWKTSFLTIRYVHLDLYGKHR